MGVRPLLGREDIVQFRGVLSRSVRQAAIGCAPRDAPEWLMLIALGSLFCPLLARDLPCFTFVIPERDIGFHLCALVLVLLKFQGP